MIENLCRVALRVVSSGMSAVLLMAKSTLEQIAPAVPSDGAGSGGGAGSPAIVMYGVVVALAAAAIVAKLVDLRRERDRQAAGLQAAISNALFSEATGLGIRITATARLPLWSGSTITVDVGGQVSTPRLREVALRIVSGEASRTGRVVKINDQVQVVEGE